MTASERFKRYLEGKSVDRCPAIEWAPWWKLTVERWHKEGLPAETNTVEAIQVFFGLDKSLQTNIICRTESTPKPLAHGQGIVNDESDWEKVKKTLFPPVETVMPKEKFDHLNKTRERGDTINFFTVEGFFWYPRKMFGIENHLYSFYDYPELYLEMCEAYSDWLIELLIMFFLVLNSIL